jgi:hypothetical protein
MQSHTFRTLPVSGQCSSMSVSILKSPLQHDLDDGPLVQPVGYPSLFSWFGRFRISLDNKPLDAGTPSDATRGHSKAANAVAFAKEATIMNMGYKK